MNFQEQEKLLKQRRNKYAQQLDSLNAPDGQNVGGIYVAPNALEYVAAGLRGIGALRGRDIAEKELKSLEQEKTQASQKALTDFLRQSKGTPENAPSDGVGPIIPGQQPNMQSAYAALMNAPDEALRSAGAKGIIEIPQIQAKQAEREQEREFKRAQLQEQFNQRLEMMREQNASRQEMAAAQRDFQKEMAQQNISARREMIGLGASLRPEPAPRQAQVIQTDAGPMQIVDGMAIPIPGVDGKPVKSTATQSSNKPLTESQSKGALYLGQMRSASSELVKLPKASPVGTAAAGNTITNWAASVNAQKSAQLQNQWAEAYLRAKTGAATTKNEIDLNRRTFFPVVGDGKEVIEQKIKMRSQAERDMEYTAGSAAATAGGVNSTPKPRIRFDIQGNIIK